MKTFKNLNIVILLCCFLLCAYKCKLEPPAYTIRIRNNANHAICVAFKYGYDHCYPDTVLITPMHYDIRVTGSIKHGGSAAVVTTTLTYKEFYRSHNRNGIDTLSMFIFHADTLSKYSWNEIMQTYNILKRYDISLGEMELFRGGFDYPPSEAMRNMKMYPPYE